MTGLHIVDAVRGLLLDALGVVVDHPWAAALPLCALCLWSLKR